MTDELGLSEVMVQSATKIKIIKRGHKVEVKIRRPKWQQYLQY